MNIFQNKFLTEGILSETYYNRWSFHADFIYNSMIIISAEVLVSIIFIILSYQAHKQKDFEFLLPSSKGSQKCQNKVVQYRDRFYDLFIFPLFIGFYLNLVISLNIHFTSSIAKTFPNHQLQVFAIIFASISVYFVFVW